MTQSDVAKAAGVSQGWISELEHGSGSSGSLENWASIAAAVGQELVAFFDRAPGASQPRDLEHLRRQQLVLSIAAGGGWHGFVEAAVEVGSSTAWFVDVLLRRPSRHEIAVVEVWNLLTDVGGALRGFERKVGAVRDRYPYPWRVSGLFVVRGTRRNRALVHELPDVFGSVFLGSSRAWLRSLTRVDAPMPALPGLLWTDARYASLVPSRSVGHAIRGPRHHVEL